MTPYDRSSRMRTTIRSSGYSHREVADLLTSESRRLGFPIHVSRRTVDNWMLRDGAPNHRNPSEAVLALAEIVLTPQTPKPPKGSKPQNA